MALRFLRRSGVGVVEMSGMIGGALRVPVYSRILDAVRRDRRFKSVVVEIDSPGGAASGSELLYRQPGQGQGGEARGRLHQGHRGLGGLLHRLRRQQDRRPAHLAGGVHRRDLPEAGAGAATGEAGGELLRAQGWQAQGHGRLLAGRDPRGGGQAGQPHRRDIRQLRGRGGPGAAHGAGTGAGAGHRGGLHWPWSPGAGAGGRAGRLRLGPEHGG